MCNGLSKNIRSLTKLILKNRKVIWTYKFLRNFTYVESTLIEVQTKVRQDIIRISYKLSSIHHVLSIWAYQTLAHKLNVSIQVQSKVCIQSLTNKLNPLNIYSINLFETILSFYIYEKIRLIFKQLIKR